MTKSSLIYENNTKCLKYFLHFFIIWLEHLKNWQQMIAQYNLFKKH